MPNQIVRTGILLIVGIFSLMACASRDILSDQQRPAEIPSDSKPTATSNTVPPNLPSHPPLPDLGQAPGIKNEVWLNSDTPLSLETLAGKVVLLEFWTFG